MKRSTTTIFFILALCTLMLSGIWIYFQKKLEQVDLADSVHSTVYDRHYVLIADDGNSLLWDSIYESAEKEAAASNAYLELIRPDDNPEYTLADCLRIAIASKVDGIILRPDGSEEIRGLIDLAADQNIPVVTVLEDDSASSRISFVGLNSYQMGAAYTEQAQKLLNPDFTEIMALIDSNASDAGTNLVYTYMTRLLEQKRKSGQLINITAYSVDSSSDFDAEEVIRDIFVNSTNLPDILICMDEIITECAYQALIDYNQVGNVDIIGFYYSDTILEAVRRGTISATIALDTEEIGRYSVNALGEYLSLGHTSSYYSVGLNIIIPDNATDFLYPVGSEDLNITSQTDL